MSVEGGGALLLSLFNLTRWGVVCPAGGKILFESEPDKEYLTVVTFPTFTVRITVSISPLYIRI